MQGTQVGSPILIVEVAGMEKFFHQSPTRVHFGEGATSKLADEIASLGLKHPLLVFGRSSAKKTGAYNDTIATLQKLGIEWEELWGIRPNPTLGKVLEGVEIARRAGCDGVIAVGGGSVIDTAKTIAAGVFLKDVWAAFDRNGGSRLIKKALPIVVVLTLSGTGSETNAVAVITNEKTGDKWNIASPHIIPRVTIMDPKYQIGLPPKLTAMGAADSISHILENSLGAKGHEPTMFINVAVIENIIRATDILVEDPGDANWRKSLMWDASLAFGLGRLSGLGVRGDWLAHAIEHALSGLNPDIAHGEGLAVIQPAVLKMRLEENGELPILKRLTHVLGVGSAQQVPEALWRVFNRWGLATSLTELGITEDMWETIYQKAISFRSKTRAFGEVSREQVLKVLKYATR